MSELSQKNKGILERWQEFLNDPDAYTQRNYPKYELLYRDIQADSLSLFEPLTTEVLKKCFKNQRFSMFIRAEEESGTVLELSSLPENHRNMLYFHFKLEEMWPFLALENGAYTVHVMNYRRQSGKKGVEFPDAFAAGTVDYYMLAGAEDIDSAMKYAMMEIEQAMEEDCAICYLAPNKLRTSKMQAVLAAGNFVVVQHSSDNIPNYPCKVPFDVLENYVGVKRPYKDDIDYDIDLGFDLPALIKQAPYLFLEMPKPEYKTNEAHSKCLALFKTSGADLLFKLTPMAKNTNLFSALPWYWWIPGTRDKCPTNIAKYCEMINLDKSMVDEDHTGRLPYLETVDFVKEYAETLHLVYTDKYLKRIEKKEQAAVNTPTQIHRFVYTCERSGRKEQLAPPPATPSRPHPPIEIGNELRDEKRSVKRGRAGHLSKKTKQWLKDNSNEWIPEHLTAKNSVLLSKYVENHYGWFLTHDIIGRLFS